MNLEREFWDAQAADLSSARAGVWSEPAEDYESRIGDCLAEIMPSLEQLGAGARILDLGCGVGRLAHAIARARPSWQIVGVDVSSRMLAHAERDKPANVTLHLGDGRALPEVGLLAGAYSMVCFQHIPRDAVEAYLRQIRATMRPGGLGRFQIVLGVDDVFLNHHWSVDAFQAACDAAGFTIEAFEQGLLYQHWGWITCRAT